MAAARDISLDAAPVLSQLNNVFTLNILHFFLNSHEKKYRGAVPRTNRKLQDG